MRGGLVTLCVFVLGGILALVIAGSRDRVYTVPQVLWGLGHHPSAWVGRMALVWGTALQVVPGCPSHQWCPTGLYKPHTPRPGPILLLEPGPADPLAARLRQVPLVNRVLPPPQRLRWQTPATYRLLFQAVPNTTCDGLPCVNACLVDAAL